MVVERTGDVRFFALSCESPPVPPLYLSCQQKSIRVGSSFGMESYRHPQSRCSTAKLRSLTWRALSGLKSGDQCLRNARHHIQVVVFLHKYLSIEETCYLCGHSRLSCFAKRDGMGGATFALECPSRSNTKRRIGLSAHILHLTLMYPTGCEFDGRREVDH